MFTVQGRQKRTPSAVLFVLNYILAIAFLTSVVALGVTPLPYLGCPTTRR